MKRNLKIFAVTIILLACLLSAVHSETDTLSFGLKIWYPDNWQKVYDTDRLIVRSPDGKAIAMFIIMDAGDLRSAQALMEAEMARIFSDITVVTQPTVVKVNKLDSTIIDGVGVVGGVKSMWIARAVVYNKKALMILGCVDTTKFSLYKSTVGKIVEGVKK